MKKLISILSTLVLALQLTTAYAAGTPTATLGNAEGEKGATVTLTLDLANVEYWSNLWFEIEYDNTALKQMRPPVSSVVGNDVWGGTGTSVSQINSQTPFIMPYNVGWNCPTATCTYNGTLATFYFQILDAAEAGKTYDITLRPYKGTEGTWTDGVEMNFWTDYDVTWSNVKSPLNLTYVSGSIKVAGGAVETTLAATKTDDTVSITATGETIEGKFIVAAYNGNELAEVIVKDAKASETATITAAYDDVKVMWWDSLTGLNSIAPAVDL